MAKEDEKPDAPAHEVPHPKAEEKEKMEKKQAEPDPYESVPEAATTEIEEQPENPSKTEPEEQVKVEVVEEKPEEATKRADGPKQSMEVAEKQKETLKTVEDEVVVKIEAPQAETVEGQAEQEQSEVADVVEKIIEITSRERLEDLMRKEKENQDQVIEEKTSHSSAIIDKQVFVEDEDVKHSSVTEIAVNNGPEPEDTEKDASGFKEVEGVTEELGSQVKKAQDNLEKNKEINEEDKLQKDVGSIQQTEEAENNTETSVEVERVRDKGYIGDLAPSEETKDPETKEEKIPGEPIKEREVEEVTKPEENRIKDAQDETKEEDSAKPVSKQSNNIISKVKHSLVKAKKAIIRKSPSCKSISTDVKG